MKNDTSLVAFMSIMLFFIIGCCNITNRIIIRYYQKKAPGQQSMVDYFYVDFLQHYSLISITLIAPFYFGFFNSEYIRPYENVAYFASAIIEFLNLLTLLKLLMFLFVKYACIYDGTFLGDLEEKQLNKTVNKIQTVTSISLIFMEYFANFHDKNHFMIFNLLTTGN